MIHQVLLTEAEVQRDCMPAVVFPERGILPAALQIGSQYYVGLADSSSV